MRVPLAEQLLGCQNHAPHPDTSHCIIPKLLALSVPLEWERAWLGSSAGMIKLFSVKVSGPRSGRRPQWLEQ